MELKAMTTGAGLAALALVSLVMTPAEAGGADAGNRPTGVEPHQSCKTQATEQKLTDAEKDSFIAKCEAEATPPGIGTFSGVQGLSGGFNVHR